MNQSHSTSSSNRRNLIYIATGLAITIAALMLRIYQIGQDELWFDEAFSFYMVTISKWPDALLRDNNPPFYYVLLRAWIGIFGQSEAAIRSLSAISGALFVAAMFWLTNQFFDRGAALLCGIFSALAPIQIYYSQEARVYALLLLFIVLAYATLLRGLATDSLRWWVLFSVCVLLALYSHYFAILALIPTVVLIGLWPHPEKSPRVWLRYSISAGIALLLFAPWLIWTVPKISESLATIDWIRDLWMQTGPLLALPKSIEGFTLGSQAEFTSLINVKRFGELLFPQSLRLVGLTAAAILLMATMIPRHSGSNLRPWGSITVWLWITLLFPLLGLCAVSFYRPIYAVGRYDILAFPAYALLLASGWSRLRDGGKIGAFLAAFVALALFIPVGVKLVKYYSAPPDDYARPTARALLEYVRNQDVLVLSRSRAKTTIYYLIRMGYRWEDGTCNDGAAGHKFTCLMFPPDSPLPVAAATGSKHVFSVEDWSRKLLGQLQSTDGVLWMVFDGDILPDGRLQARRPLSTLIKLFESSRFRAVPIDSEYGIVEFQR